ncbi:ATP-binding protein [Amycolatopsis sp. lyj-23]|uniref:ATP-binding protein n=1 Tax=Amycolatopsis sp. lyj-23 TaxID=2789283 RepID=UPI00397A53F0
MPDTASFGMTLVRLRRAAGLTQEQLAQRCGLSARGVGNLERGDRHPRRVTVQLLADGLDLPEADRAELLDAARRSRLERHEGRAPAIPAEPDLVGRGAERAIVHDHVAGAGPPLLVLTGQTGIGKSRLLAEASARARAGGMVVLAASCPRHGAEPYAPVADALARRVRDHPRAGGPPVGGLAWLLPEMGTGEPAPARPHRRVLFAEAARFLGALSERTGALVVLDDLHWAGPDALALLVSLLQDLPPGRVRFLAAYRDTETAPSGPLADALLDLVRHGLLARLPLAPLAEADAGVLLDKCAGEGVDAPARDRVLRLAGGLPLFLVQLGHALGGGHDAAGELPWGLAHAVRRQLGSLPPPTVDVLTVLAVGQHRLSVAVLAAAAGLDPDDVPDVLAPAHAVRLLDENADGVRLTHELVAEVINAGLQPSRRHVLHRRLADALGPAPGGSRAAAAYHYTHAQDPERAAQTLRHAAEQAGRQAAHDAAAQHLGDLVALLERTGPRTAVAEAAEDLANALAAAGRYDAALAAAERALLGYREDGDEERRRMVIARIGHFHYQRGTPREGLALLAPTLADDRPEESTVRLQLARAANLYQSTRYRETVDVCTAAIAAATAAGDDHGLAGGHLRRGLATRLLGRNAAALADLHTAAATAELCGDREIVVRALTGVAVVHHYRGDLVRADRQYARILQLAEELGDRELLSRAVCNLGASATYLGHWRLALRRFDRALELASHGSSPMCESMALIGRGTLLSACGRHDAAREDLTRVIRLGRDSDNIDLVRNTTAQLVESDVRTGRPERGVARLTPLLDLPGEHTWQLTDALPFLAEAQLAAGDPVTAARTARAAATRAAAIEHGIARTEALRVLGAAAAARGAWPEASATLEEALGLAEAAESPYLTARVHASRATAAAARGDERAAATDHATAEDLFTALRRDAGTTEN